MSSTLQVACLSQLWQLHQLLFSMIAHIASNDVPNRLVTAAHAHISKMVATGFQSQFTCIANNVC
jgi:hypothetical protein